MQREQGSLGPWVEPERSCSLFPSSRPPSRNGGRQDRRLKKVFLCTWQRGRIKDQSWRQAEYQEFLKTSALEHKASSERHPTSGHAKGGGPKLENATCWNGKCNTLLFSDQSPTSKKIKPNTFFLQVVGAVRGEYGMWVGTAVAILVEFCCYDKLCI